LNLTKTNQNLKKLHFLVVGFVLLNFIIQIITGYGVNTKLIFILKIIIYFSGIALFILNIKPFRKISFYFSFYSLSLLVILIFRVFGGIFLGLLSSIILFPIYPKEVKYEKDNLKVYEKFNGFLGSCCEYEIVENKLLIFEKNYGQIKLEGSIEIGKSEIKMIHNVIENKHKVKNYKSESKTEIEIDTVKKIKLK